MVPLFLCLRYFPSTFVHRTAVCLLYGPIQLEIGLFIAYSNTYTHTDTENTWKSAHEYIIAFECQNCIPCKNSLWFRLCGCVCHNAHHGKTTDSRIYRMLATYNPYFCTWMCSVCWCVRVQAHMARTFFDFYFLGCCWFCLKNQSDFHVLPSHFRRQFCGEQATHLQNTDDKASATAT